MKLYKGIFESWEIAVTRNLVKQFQERCPSLEREFIDDLTDECLKHWLSKRDKYDLKRIEKPKSFLATVVSNKLLDLVRHRTAQKREKYFISESLEQFLEDDPDTHILANTAQVNQPTEIDQADLKFRLEQVLQKLNPQQKKIFQALRDEDLTITEISVRLKVHRATVHNEIKRIREIFENEGLRKYLA